MHASRRVTAAAIAAALVILAGGGVSRWLTAAYDASAARPMLGPGALDRLPLQIGSWIGLSRTLDDAIVRAADVDSYILRGYSRFGRESVGLYVGFGIRTRDLTPHRPEVCYPAGGYTLRDRHAARRLSGGAEIPARILTFSSPGLGASNVAVLTFYIVDGRVVDDVAEFRWSMWRGRGAARYIAQVQISTAFGAAEQAAAARSVLEEFTEDAGSAVVAAVVEAVAAAEGAVR